MAEWANYCQSNKLPSKENVTASQRDTFNVCEYNVNISYQVANIMIGLPLLVTKQSDIANNLL